MRLTGLNEFCVQEEEEAGKEKGEMPFSNWNSNKWHAFNETRHRHLCRAVSCLC